MQENIKDTLFSGSIPAEIRPKRLEEYRCAIAWLCFQEEYCIGNVSLIPRYAGNRYDFAAHQRVSTRFLPKS